MRYKEERIIVIYLPPKEVFQKQYERYATKYLHLIKGKYGMLSRDIEIKLPHGISMMNAVEGATRESGFFNESYYLSAALEGCFHDIGRFLQYYATGTLKDADSEKIIHYKDHGNLGKRILLTNHQELLREILPIPSSYDKVFTEVIGEHTTIRNRNYQIPITELTNLFQEYSLEEILKAKDQNLKNQLIALKLAILQEMDCLELLQNIISGAWIPVVSSDPSQFADAEVWDDFINFRYIHIKKYRLQDRWTANNGFLLRYGLLMRQMSLVCTLKEFEHSKGFDKIWKRAGENTVDEEGYPSSINDPYLLKAQEYVQLAVQNLIKTSPDGVLITPESREKAKVLTKQEWGKL